MRKKIPVTSILFLLPALLLIAVFFVYPLIRTFIISFQTIHVTGHSEFVGFGNYMQAFEARDFWLSLNNTVIYTIIVTPMIFVPAIFLAVILQKTSLFTKLLRTVYFIPFVLSFVVASFTWKWIYNDTYGVLNYLLMSLHLIKTPINWLGDTWIARIMVSVMVVWKTQGFTMIILIAGLQAIPDAVIEAARIDGAGKKQIFWFVTLPLLRPTLVMALIISIIGSFKAFDHFYIMTGGGPLRTTQTIIMYLNKLAFEYFELGKGAAISVIFLVILLVLNYGQLKLGGHADE